MGVALSSDQRITPESGMWMVAETVLPGRISKCITVILKAVLSPILDSGAWRCRGVMEIMGTDTCCTLAPIPISGIFSEELQHKIHSYARNPCTIPGSDDANPLKS